MQLLRSSEVPIADAPVFYYLRLAPVLSGLLVLCSGIACIVVGRLELSGVERYVSYYVGVVLLLCLYLWRYITARFRDFNWRLTTACF
jgi:hypothetical protein